MDKLISRLLDTLTVAFVFLMVISIVSIVLANMPVGFQPAPGFQPVISEPVGFQPARSEPNGFILSGIGFCVAVIARSAHANR